MRLPTPNVFSLAIGWSIGIAFASLLPGFLFPPFQQSFNNLHLDKIAHFVMYFIYMLVWTNYVQVKQIQDITFAMTIGIVFLSGMIYGTLLEIFQFLLHWGRSGNMADIAANITGLTSAAGWKIIKRKKLHIN